MPGPGGTLVPHGTVLVAAGPAAMAGAGDVIGSVGGLGPARARGDPIELLTAGVDALADADPADATTAAITEQLVALRTLTDRLDAQFARRLAIFDARGGATGDGATNTVAWLRWKCRQTPRAAAEQVQLARGLPDLPATRTAFGAGEISARHASVIARTAADVGPAAMAADGGGEATLVEAARGLDPTGLRTAAERLRHAPPPRPRRPTPVRRTPGTGRT